MDHVFQLGINKNQEGISRKEYDREVEAYLIEFKQDFAWELHVVFADMLQRHQLTSVVTNVCEDLLLGSSKA